MNQPNPANIRQPSFYRRHPLLRGVLNPVDIHDDPELKKLFRFERHNLLIIIGDQTCSSVAWLGSRF